MMLYCNGSISLGRVERKLTDTAVLKLSLLVGIDGSGEGAQTNLHHCPRLFHKCGDGEGSWLACLHY